MTVYLPINLLNVYTLYSSIIEPVFSRKYNLACAPIEDSDQTAHLRSLIRVFDGRSMGSQGSNSSSGGKKKTQIRPCGCAAWCESSLYEHANLYHILDTGFSIPSIFMVIRCSYFNKPLFSNMLMVFVTIILIITNIDNVKGIRMRRGC